MRLMCDNFTKESQVFFQQERNYESILFNDRYEESEIIGNSAKKTPSDYFSTNIDPEILLNPQSKATIYEKICQVQSIFRFIVLVGFHSKNSPLCSTLVNFLDYEDRIELENYLRYSRNEQEIKNQNNIKDHKDFLNESLLHSLNSLKMQDMDNEKNGSPEYLYTKKLKNKIGDLERENIELRTYLKKIELNYSLLKNSIYIKNDSFPIDLNKVICENNVNQKELIESLKWELQEMNKYYYSNQSQLINEFKETNNSYFEPKLSQSKKRGRELTYLFA